MLTLACTVTVLAWAKYGLNNFVQYRLYRLRIQIESRKYLVSPQKYIL